MIKVLLFVGLCLLSRGADFVYDEGILVITDQNFDFATKQFEMMLLEVYAPWCGHCKQLAPQYIQAAKTLKQSGSTVVLAKVDGTLNRDLPQTLGIQGYPTLFFFRNGKKEEFDGGRTADDIVEWIKKKTEIGSVLIRSTEQLDKLVDKQKVVLMMFSKAKEEPEFQQFAKFIVNHDDLQYAHTFESVVAAESRIYGPKLVLYKKEGDKVKQVDFQGTFSQESIEDFIDKNSFPQVMDFGLRAAKRIFGGKQTALVLFYKQSSTEQTPQVIKFFDKISERYKGKILFARANYKDKVESKIYEHLLINPLQLPQVRVVDASGAQIKTYLMNRPATEENMIDFYSQYAQKAFKPYYPGQEQLPKPDGIFQVIISWKTFIYQQLIAKTFWTTVQTQGKDALVYFYNGANELEGDQWNALNKVGRGVKSNPNILLTKMDISLNQVPDFAIYHTPAIFLFNSKGEKYSPAEYFGEINYDQLFTWLKDQSTVQWVESERYVDEV